MQIASTGKLPPAPLGQGGGLPSKDKCLQTSLENKGAFPLHFGGVPSSPPHPPPRPADPRRPARPRGQCDTPGKAGGVGGRDSGARLPAFAPGTATP